MRWELGQADTGSIQTTGPSFDGSTGVDSQDISNIPSIVFSALYVFLSGFFSVEVCPNKEMKLIFI